MQVRYTNQGNRRGVTIRRPGNRATQQFRLTSTLPPRLTTTEEPTTTAASETATQQQKQQRPIAIRPPASTTASRASSRNQSQDSSRNRFRQRTRGRGSTRLRRPTATAATTTTTTTTTPTTATTTTPSTTTTRRPAPTTTRRPVPTTTPRPVPTTVPSVATVSDQQVPRPTSQRVRDLDPNAPSTTPEEDVEYDYYYDYVFEYPDGTVKEIPAEELVKLRAEIELAKRLLQTKEGRSLPSGAFDQTLVSTQQEAAPGAERKNPGGPPRQRLSSDRGPVSAFSRSQQSRRPPSGNPVATSSRPQRSRQRPTAAAVASDPVNFLDEAPPGYEVAEYEYDIAGDVDEDVVIIEDEQGRRVVSTTYRPVEGTETGFRGAEDSTLRPFIVRDSTSPPRSSAGREERPVGRVVPPIRLLNAINQRRQEVTTAEALTEAEPVTTLPPPPRRTPATIRSFRPRSRQPLEQTTEAPTVFETTTPFGSLRQSAAKTDRSQQQQQQQQEQQRQQQEATTWRPPLGPTTIQTLIERQRQRLGPLRPLPGSGRQSSAVGRQPPAVSQQPEDPQYRDDAQYDVQYLDDAQYEDYTEYPDDARFNKDEPTTSSTTTTTTTITTTTTRPTTTTTTTTEAASSEAAPAEENEVLPGRGGRRFGSRAQLNRLRPGRRRGRPSRQENGRPSRQENAATTTEAAISSTATEEEAVQTTERTRLAPVRPSRRRRPSSRRQRPGLTTTTEPTSTTEAEPEETQETQQEEEQERVTPAPSRRLSAAARRRQSSRQAASRRRLPSRARPTTTTTTTTTEQSQEQETEAPQEQEQETTTAASGSRIRRPGLSPSRRRNRLGSLRRRPTRPTTESTTEFANPPTTETAASIRRGTVVPPAVTTAFTPTTTAERTELAFEQFVRDQAHDNMTREQLRELFNRTIQKQAVFVRRKPGSAAPEIIGRGTVISQPGGDRRLIVNNRPGVIETSEITLIESSTLSSLLGTTPAPRTGISPRPDQAPRRARPLGRPTFRPRLPTLGAQQEQTEDQRSAARQVIEDVTARTIASPFDDEVRGTSARSVIQLESGFSRGRDRDEEEARFTELGQGLFQLRTQEPFVLPGAAASRQREFVTNRPDLSSQELTESSGADLVGASTDRADFEAAGFTDRSGQDAKPEASTEHLIRKQVVRLVPLGTRQRAELPRPTTFSPVQFEEGAERPRRPRLLTSAPRRVQVNRRRLDLSSDGDQTVGEVRIEMAKEEAEGPVASTAARTPRGQRPQRIRVVSRRRPASRRSASERRGEVTTARPKTAHELALEAHEKAIEDEQKRREEELVRRAEEEKRRKEELERRAEVEQKSGNAQKTAHELALEAHDKAIEDEQKRREEELVRRAEEEKRRKEELVRRAEEEKRGQNAPKTAHELSLEAHDTAVEEELKRREEELVRRAEEEKRREAQKELVVEELDRRTAQEKLVAEELARRRAAAREVAEEEKRREEELGRREAQKDLVVEELDRRTAQENLVAEELARRRAAARVVAALQAQQQQQQADLLQSGESVRSSVVSTGTHGGQQPLRHRQQVGGETDAVKSDQSPLIDALGGPETEPSTVSPVSATDFPPYEGDYVYYDDGDYYYDDDYVRSLPVVDTAPLEGSTEVTVDGATAAAADDSSRWL